MKYHAVFQYLLFWKTQQNLKLSPAAYRWCFKGYVFKMNKKMEKAKEKIIMNKSL